MLVRYYYSCRIYQPFFVNTLMVMSAIAENYDNNMTNKLIQKHLLKGTHEFEIVDDAVNIRIKTPLRLETLTVMLMVLKPEPVENGNYLEFHSRVKPDALISLRKDNPSAKEFTAFVELLKQRALAEYNAFLGIGN